MALGRTVVVTQLSPFLAGLLTRTRITGILVAGPVTLVHITRQGPLAWFPTRHITEVTGHVVPDLVAAHTHLVDQLDTGRAGGIVVTGVVHGVGAGVVPGARLTARGRCRATRYRWLQSSSSARAVYLTEIAVQAGHAVSLVAQLLALVLLAGEGFPAWNHTNVVVLEAALRGTPVSPARLLLVTYPATFDPIRGDV